VSEFAEAGWIREWTGAHARAVREDTLEVPLETATWEGKLYAAPFSTNTQLLWYRADLVPRPPATWDEMIQMAEQLAEQGKPHYVEIQGAPYEGLTVWFNTLVESAGGSILSEDSESVALGEPARRALALMARLANSRAADPSLSNQMENENRLRMEAGAAAFELNYPYVYPSMRANRPDLAPHFRWAPYPRVDKDAPARVTIGGNNLAISAYSPHPELAFEAVLCMRSRGHQRNNATQGGIPPTLKRLYTDPALIETFPFADAVRASLEGASVRPKTPAYQSASVVISHTLSPPREIEPERTLKTLHSLLRDALASRGVIP
jgi:multiple sugar transport system substrate-binding protein